MDKLTIPRFQDGSRCRRSSRSRDILDVCLAAGDEDLIARLAFLAADAIEERDALAELLRAALDQLHRQTMTIDRQREMIAVLRRRLPDHEAAA